MPALTPYWSDDACTLYLGDCREVLAELPEASVDAVVTDPPAGIAFMGREWDTDKGGRREWIAWLTGVMVEAYRVLKPGGHALVWALPRTSHWTATALEDAGFEVRDCVVHLFGSGFPKSLDVGKAIDRAAGAEREVIGRIASPASNGHAGTVALGGAWQDVPMLTAPATPDAQRWDGWHTALKPGSEHWWLVRKPIRGTVAANVLEHGVGAINVGATRVGSGGQGRWPTNLVLTHSATCLEGGPCADDCPAGELDSQSSGASQFFPTFRYQAKAPSKERPKVNGIAHPTAKSLGLMKFLCRLVTPPGGTVLDMFAGSGTTLEAATLEGFQSIGIEAEPDYMPLITARLSKAVQADLFGADVKRTLAT